MQRRLRPAGHARGLDEAAGVRQLGDALARDADLRRAVIYGSAMGSFAVEKFSVERFKDLTVDEIEERVRHFREMTVFELPVNAGV